MTTESWIFMIVAVSSVTIFFAWSLYLVLTRGKR